MRRVFLVGFMGCGKSSFGRRLARQLGWDFVDTDAEIERRAGMTIAEIFAIYGEERFRELEREVIDDICYDRDFSSEVIGLCTDRETEGTSKLSRLNPEPSRGAERRSPEYIQNTREARPERPAEDNLQEPVGDEQTCNDEASSNKGLIVALGGGSVCKDGVMEQLNVSGTTIYLRMPPSRLVRRMGVKGRARRPKIAGMNDAELREFIEKVLPQREVWYKKANFVLDLGGLPDSRIVEVLMKHT